VLTTNAGSDRKGGSMGFGKSITDQSEERVTKALSEFLRPEFLNRIDSVICFNQLTEEDFKKIARIMLDELEQSLREKPITFAYSADVVDYLAQKSFSIKYGARELRRLIQREIEDKIAGIIIEAYDRPVSTISLSVGEDGNIKFDYSPR
jgi:ATP-dependent Clp protease ATP-binding subunit ClpC